MPRRPERAAVLPRGLRFQHRVAQRPAAPRAHQFEMAEPCPPEHFRTCRIIGDKVGHRLPQPFARAAPLQPDKIDNDAAGQLAQPHLPRDRPAPQRGWRQALSVRPIRRLGRAGIDIDQHCGAALLDMDAATALPAAAMAPTPASKAASRSIGQESRRLEYDLGLRKGLAQFGLQSPIVDQDLLRFCRRAAGAAQAQTRKLETTALAGRAAKPLPRRPAGSCPEICVVSRAPLSRWASRRTCTTIRAPSSRRIGSLRRSGRNPGRSVADIDQYRVEPRDAAHHPPEMDAAGRWHGRRARRGARRRRRPRATRRAIRRGRRRSAVRGAPGAITVAGQ